MDSVRLPDLKNKPILNELDLPDTDKEQSVINKNLEAIRHRAIMKACYNANQKYNRKLTRKEKQQFLRKLAKEQGVLRADEFTLINNILIGYRKSGDIRVCPKGYRWHTELKTCVRIMGNKRDEIGAQDTSALNEVF